MFLFTLDFFHNSFHFLNIFSLCYYFISHGIYTTIYFLNTYKSYDLFLSQPSLIHIINHCVIISNSHRHLIHNIYNSSHFFCFLSIYYIYDTLSIQHPCYIEKFLRFIIHSTYFMSISIIYNLSHKLPPLLYLKDVLILFFFSIKLCPWGYFNTQTLTCQHSQTHVHLASLHVIVAGNWSAE